MASILRQTLSSLELIVIDDGSTDASAAIAENFVRGDRIKAYLDRRAG